VARVTVYARVKAM